MIFSDSKINVTGSTMTGASPIDKSVTATETDWFRGVMLDWYDHHRRVLPWRALPGETADPYRVWLSEVMLQQTTVGAVIAYFNTFVGLWPTVESLAAAPEEDVMKAWAGLGYYSRARNLHKCAKAVVQDHGGSFPADEGELLRLPGIGAYTAAAIASIAFDRPAVVIDGNIERVVARYFLIEEPLPAAKKAIRHYASLISEGRIDRPGDFAQSLMDLGSAVCIPKNPRCVLCPLMPHCRARGKGLQNEIPRRPAKVVKPKRKGYAYWITNKKGEVLLCRRPGSGLLGGMASLPSSEWIDVSAPDAPAHPIFLTGREDAFEILPEAKIRHVFTHFELTLVPVRLEWLGNAPEGYYWAGLCDWEEWGLPGVFKKVAAMLRITRV
jgi:A/G-specific adenine glycosylase